MLSLPPKDADKTLSYKINVPDRYGSVYADYINVESVPYTNETLVEVAATYGIKIPFAALMTPDQGKSICSECGAVYAGYQPRCNQKVRLIYYKHGYDTLRKVSESGVLNEILGRSSNGNPIRVTNVIPNEHCGGHLRWEFQKEFEKQQRFFSMLSLIKTFEDSSPLAEFRDCFLPGIKEQFELKLVIKNLDNALFELQQHKNALNQIANKMNAAGNNLSFGF